MANVVQVWVSRRQAAAIAGCGERNFDASVRTKLPKTAIKGRAKKLEFDAVPLVALLLEQQSGQGKQALTDEEALLAGPDSPALERFRLGRAKLVEIELAEREKKLIRVDVVTEALQPAIAAMRTTGERLAKQFGNDAAEIYNEGVSEFEAAALRVLAKTESQGQSPTEPGG